MEILLNFKKEELESINIIRAHGARVESGNKESDKLAVLMNDEGSIDKLGTVRANLNGEISSFESSVDLREDSKEETLDSYKNGLDEEEVLRPLNYSEDELTNKPKIKKLEKLKSYEEKDGYVSASILATISVITIAVSILVSMYVI